MGYNRSVLSDDDHQNDDDDDENDYIDEDNDDDDYDDDGALTTNLSTISGASTCRTLPSTVFTCSSQSDNESFVTVQPKASPQEISRQRRNSDGDQNDEFQIADCTKTDYSTKKTKRRVHSEEISYGERIADDLINEYCDKLNTALRNRFDGMLAIQYIALDPQNLDRLITGRKPVLQILLDQKREHYVLVERTLQDDTVVVFDSLATSKKKARDALNRGLAEQIFNMFKHVSPKRKVKVRYEIAIEKQNDMWSCGLRTIAYITCRAFNYDPRCYLFNMEKVFKYFCNLLNEQNPSAEKFQHACGRFGTWRERDLQAEEAIFQITKQSDHQIHIEDTEIQLESMNEKYSSDNDSDMIQKKNSDKTKQKSDGSRSKSSSDCSSSN